jgi:hypothetical protein
MSELPVPPAQNGESEFRTWTRETTVSYRTWTRTSSSSQTTTTATATTQSTTNIVGAGGGCCESRHRPRRNHVSNQQCAGCQMRNEASCHCISCNNCKRKIKKSKAFVSTQKTFYADKGLTFCDEKCYRKYARLCKDCGEEEAYSDYCSCYEGRCDECQDPLRKNDNRIVRKTILAGCLGQITVRFCDENCGIRYFTDEEVDNDYADYYQRSDDDYESESDGEYSFDEDEQCYRRKLTEKDRTAPTTKKGWVRCYSCVRIYPENEKCEHHTKTFNKNCCGCCQDDD